MWSRKKAEPFLPPRGGLTRDFRGPNVAAIVLFAIIAQISLPGSADRVSAGTETTYPSRGIQVPATVTMPVAQTDRAPFVILVHGHGGNREEAGAFGRMASELADRGIGSIRMDFAGCGDSVEPFTRNHLGTMLEDIAAAKAFMLGKWPVDAGRVAILGYSMGGRLAVISSQQEPYQAMALWAPVGLDGADGMLDFLGGPDAWQSLSDHAEQHGSVLFTTPWGQEQQLSREWFEHMESSRPQSAIADFSGAVLLIHGAADAAVPASNSRVLATSAVLAESIETILIEDAGHGLGFYSGNETTAAEVIDRTVSFFAQQLLSGRNPTDNHP